MPTKLSTTIKKIELVPNPDNARLIFEQKKLVYRVYIRVIMIKHLKWTLCLKTQKV
jgi:hypothetical protein